jgi:hypothetical protein
MYKSAFVVSLVAADISIETDVGLTSDLYQFG